MESNRYLVYCAEDGWEEAETRDQAIAIAESVLLDCSADARLNREWPESTEYIGAYRLVPVAEIVSEEGEDWVEYVLIATPIEPELPEDWKMNTHDCACGPSGIEAMVDHHGLTVDWYGLDGMTETAIPLDVIRYLIARWEARNAE